MIYKKIKKIFKNKRSIGLIVFVLLIGLISIIGFIRQQSAKAEWFSDGWHYRRKLTFNNASSTENLANFPVLVTLNSSRVDYNNTQNSGQDIRFTDPDGKILDYEIEKWDETATSTVWVKIPQIDVQSTIDYIYVYYGNPSASSGQVPSNVWDSNYKMVQHLEESCSSSNCILDSTSNANNGTPYSTTTITNLATSTAKINGGDNFDGTDDYLDIGTSYNGVKTIEFWLKANNTTKDVIDLNGSAYISASSGVATTTGFTSPTIYIDSVVTSTIDTNWHYVVVITDTGINASNLDVGRREDSTYFDGILDEVRLSNAVRSAEWIEAQYKSMSDTYITYASEEKQPEPIAWWRLDESSGTTAYDETNNNNDGTITSGAWITGKYGKGLSFNGTSTKVAVPDANSLDMGTNDWSISAWIKTNASATSSIIEKAGSSVAWYNPSWDYRKSITLSRLSGAVTNYQMQVIVNRSTGTDSGTNVYVGTKCLDTYNDIRFTKSDGTTLLDYWIESSNSASSSIWVEFDSIGTSATTFYMYYGNSSASAVSNGTSTFITFDDFERGNDGDAVGGSWQLGSGTAIISTTQFWGGTRSMQLVGSSTAVARNIAVTASSLTYEVRHRFWRGATVAGSQYIAQHGNSSKYINAFITSSLKVYYYDGSNHDTGYTIIADAWHSFIVNNIDFTAGTFDFYIDGTLMKSGATMYSSAAYNNKFGVAVNSSAAGQDGWYDNFSVRNWAVTEPAWGSWGSEESYVDKGYKMKILANGIVQVTLFTATSTSYSVTSSATVNDNAWHHIETTFSRGGNMVIYVDGQNKGSTDISAVSAVNVSSDGGFYVGADYTGAANYFSGSLDEVRVYNYARSPAEVRQDYNANLSTALPIQFGGDLSAKGTSSVAYWRMDENAGTIAYDDTVNNNDLVISGASWTTSGKFGNVLSFDGVNDQATTSNSTSLNITSDLSISAWVKAANFATTTSQWILYKDSGSAGYAFGFASTTNKLVLRIDGANYESSSAYSLASSTWHHLGATLSGTSTVFYIDGQVLGSTVNAANAPPADASSTILRIGSNNTTYFSGVLDEVRIYNYARTANEMRGDYNQGMAVVLGNSGSTQYNGWYNSGWKYRKSHAINGTTDGAQTNYQMQLTVQYGTGTDSTSTVYCSNHCNSDFSDLRFTSSDGTTLLDYWIESSTSSASALVWVEISSIPASPGGTTIYMYYGDSSASSASNGTSTFIFFDDFENNNLNLWSPVGGTWSTQGATVKYGSYAMLGTGTTTGSTITKTLSSVITAGRLRFWFRGNNTDGRYYMVHTPNYAVVGRLGHFTYYDGAYHNFPNDTTFAINTWYQIEVLFNGANSYTLNVDSSSAGTVTALTFASIGSVKLVSASTVGDDHYIDNVFLANYATTEPTWGSCGSEQKMADNPVAVWRLDEGQGGTLYDDTTNNNDGVIPTTTMNHWATSTAAKYGNAIDFDGTNDYATVPDSTSTSITGSLTISAWIRPDAVSKEQTTLGKWDETTALNDRSYRLWLDSNNRLNFSISSDGSATTTHTGTLTIFSAGTWYHIEGVYTASTSMDIYVNGKLDATQKTSSVPATIDNNISNLYIGAKENTSGDIDTKFDGAIDDVRIYNYARSASQVLVDYNGGFAARLGQ